MSPPSIGWKINQARNQHEGSSKKRRFKLVSCLAYASTLKMEMKYSSKTSDQFQQTTGRYILEDITRCCCFCYIFIVYYRKKVFINLLKLIDGYCIYIVLKWFLKCFSITRKISINRSPTEYISSAFFCKYY
jgi:hypothetical protein